MSGKVDIKPGSSISEILRGFEKQLGFKNEIKWSTAIPIVLYHVLAVYWCYHYAFPVKWQTLLFETNTISAIVIYFNYFKLMFCYILPTTLGIWLWGEQWRCAVAWQCFIRFLGMFHSELTVNSLAHAYGYRPYNKNIIPRENRFVATCTLGEGWHNYHHAFPFDYKAAEHFDAFNFCTTFINGFKWLGWAYDLREATPQMINGLANRLGDGTPLHYPLAEQTDD
ncbi:PREDICTED: acyl-CoA Delta(11) desaturase-like [Papilio polytes]|uniref:acyl-CoA Delta(11) desaturase-like n=1 Tax=Papilio polytes TaxID=76194 RepID=UPI00067697E4|nr:PREDICTED: acyl-CoA Delta(11) desaturase-like [Papilio polytes]